MISDLITEYQQTVADIATIKQQVADLQNQLATAQLQYQNDQQAIKDLRAKLSTADSLLATDAGMIETQAKQIQQAQMQLLQLQSVKVYDGLEFLPWALNTKAEVGGSGLGTGGSKLPGIEMAELWVNPNPPIAPKITNFFDGYFPMDFILDDSITRWKVENVFIFPTQADIDACECLEMESRQVLLVPKGLMFVAGVQLNYGSNTLRYWDHFKHWQASGQSCPKPKPLVPFAVAVAGHRDATTIYHDYISIDGVKTDLTGTSYPAWTESSPWRQMLRCALQIDSKESAAPTQCRVKIGNTKFTVGK